MRIFLLSFLTIVSALHAQVLDPAQTQELLTKLAEATLSSGMSVRYHETKTLKILKTPIIESGTMKFLPPNFFCRLVEHPRKTYTYFNGETLWMVFPKENLAERYPADRSKVMRDTIEGIASTIEPSHLTKRFIVTAEKQQKNYHLTLDPISPEFKKTVTKIFLTVDSKYRPCEIVIVSTSGDRSQIKLSGEKRVSLSPADFSFLPDADMEVSYPLGR